MGCALSCMQQTAMSLFGRNSNDEDNTRAKLERKLYLAKESPEPDFDLSDCQLRKVPSGIYSICKVYRKEYLYLNNNKLQSLEDGGNLSDLYLIKVLNLNCNRITELPSDIRHLASLTEFYIHDNNITTIPNEIQYLQRLKILDVSCNKLRKLPPSLGKLKNLNHLNIAENKELAELCPELCFATNIVDIKLDKEQYTFPPQEILEGGTVKIMKFLCENMNVEYNPPMATGNTPPVQSPVEIPNPFIRRNTITWEEQEAAVQELENKYHEAAKQQREKFLTQILKDQQLLDSEVAKVQEARDIERQRLIKEIQQDEKDISLLVNNFIQSVDLEPEIIQQQLAHEQAEHDRLLEITRQNYDNLKRSEILRAMEALIDEDLSIQYYKNHYDNNIKDFKKSILMQELEGSEKLEELLKEKDENRIALVENLLQNQDIQKAVVASLVERVDARSWSLNEEINLISSHLARLSTIEQEKKKMQVAFNYNELLEQRMKLVTLLDDCLDQQSKRRKQLIETMKEMEQQMDVTMTTDFWLRNYQKLIDSAPKTLLNIGKHLDPAFANYLLQEGVIHCLPFLVKFIFTEDSLLDITPEKLKQNGVILSSDREGIIRAIDRYLSEKNLSINTEEQASVRPDVLPTAPIEVDHNNCTGVINKSDSESSNMESECVVCMDNQCEVVFVPCGHMCCCQPCANKEMPSCPMCRNDIERKIKVMLP